MKALAIAAGIVFWTLVLGVALLVFFPGGNGGEPVAVLQVEPAPPAPAPAPAPTAAPPAATRGVDLPPGFSVTGPRQQQAPMLAPPGQGTNMVPTTPGQLRPPPPPPPPPGPSGSLDQGPAANAIEPKAAAAEVDETGAIVDGGLGGCGVQTSIDLDRVTSDDLDVEVIGELQRDGALSGTGGTEENEEAQGLPDLSRIPSRVWSRYSFTVACRWSAQ